MTNQYAEADIIAWVSSLRVRDQVAVFKGSDLQYKSEVKNVTDEGFIVIDSSTKYLGRPLAVTYLENGASSAPGCNLCIKPTDDAILQIGYLRVLDFSEAAGMLIKLNQDSNPFSDHLGIVVSHEIRYDEANKGIAWPVIIWEGSVTPEISHPTAVTPYRDHELKWIEMSFSKPVSA